MSWNEPGTVGTPTWRRSWKLRLRLTMEEGHMLTAHPLPGRVQVSHVADEGFRRTTLIALKWRYKR